MRHSLKAIPRCATRAWLGICLLVLFLGPASPGTAAPDPVGLGAAVAEVRAALEDLAHALNDAPRRVQTTIGTDLHLMSQAVARALDRLDNEGAPVADPTLVYDLNLLADIAHAARDDLQAIDAGADATLDPERARRIDRLTEAAAGRLAEINLVVDSWNERSRNQMIDVRDDGGVLVIRSTDRRIYDGIRYVSIALLLIGLLALGLHLLPTRQERAERRPWAPKGPLHSKVGAAVLVLFFVSCIGLSLRPGVLAALSAKVRVQAQEHPCERLAAQRDRLIVAQQADDPGLIEASKQRMRPAARDCLGLPSEAVTAEAIERLAAKTAIARNEPAAARRPAVGLAATGPNRGEAGAAPPPRVAELRPAEMQASGGLAELLTNLRGIATPADDPSKPAGGPPAPAMQSAVPPAAPPTEEVRPAVASRPNPPVGPASEPVRPTIARIEPAAGPEPMTTRETPAEPGPAVQPPEPKPVVFVTTTALNYREGPSVDARRLGTLVPGARLEVVGRDAGWAEVRLNDGRQAYVASEFLERAP